MGTGTKPVESSTSAPTNGLPSGALRTPETSPAELVGGLGVAVAAAAGAGTTFDCSAKNAPPPRTTTPAIIEMAVFAVNQCRMEAVELVTPTLALAAIEALNPTGAAWTALAERTI